MRRVRLVARRPEGPSQARCAPRVRVSRRSAAAAPRASPACAINHSMGSEPCHGSRAMLPLRVATPPSCPPGAPRPREPARHGGESGPFLGPGAPAPSPAAVPPQPRRIPSRPPATCPPLPHAAFSGRASRGSCEVRPVDRTLLTAMARGSFGASPARRKRRRSLPMIRGGGVDRVDRRRWRAPRRPERRLRLAGCRAASRVCPATRILSELYLCHILLWCMTIHGLSCP